MLPWLLFSSMISIEPLYWSWDLLASASHILLSELFLANQQLAPILCEACQSFVSVSSHSVAGTIRAVLCAVPHCVQLLCLFVAFGRSLSAAQKTCFLYIYLGSLHRVTIIRQHVEGLSTYTTTQDRENNTLMLMNMQDDNTFDWLAARPE